MLYTKQWIHLIKPVYQYDTQLSLIQRCTVFFRVTNQVELIITSDLYFRGAPHGSWLCCQLSTCVILWLLSVSL